MEQAIEKIQDKIRELKSCGGRPERLPECYEEFRQYEVWKHHVTRLNALREALYLIYDSLGLMSGVLVAINNEIDVHTNAIYLNQFGEVEINFRHAGTFEQHEKAMDIFDSIDTAKV